jgi:hypothetical protein
MIARTWRDWVRTDQAAVYVEYITRTGLSEYEKTPGNLGAQMWKADLGDGRTPVTASLPPRRGVARPVIDQE